jgi:N utilization substance protein A
MWAFGLINRGDSGMKSEFLLAFNEICESRGLSKAVVLETIETALVSAFRRNVGVSNAQNIIARVDPQTGMATILAEKEVVESVQDDRTEVALRKARQLSDEPVALGDMLMVDSTPRDFGRIAAQTAKQVILQRIREAERDQLYEDFSGREGEIINGTVQSVTAQAVTIGLGRTEALLPRNQQVPGERYFPHDKVRAYVLEVRRASRGPQIIVSRSHRNMLRRMLELEVPEIYNGLVDIKSVAREAGQRSKVAVSALQDGVDPVGACVGMRGVRIQSIVRELNDEKIDVIEWNADPRIFIAKSLSPARVSHVFLLPDAESGKTATVIVADDQLSLAIGREGQNARLAAKLTGWRIDIKSLTEATAEALAKRDDPVVVDVFKRSAALMEQAKIILAKKEAGRPITAEDFQTLSQVIERIEGRFEVLAEEERKAQDAARKAVPAHLWQIPLDILNLSDTVAVSLSEGGCNTVGDVMAGLGYSPDQFKNRFNLDDTGLAELQERMATTDFPKTAAEAPADSLEIEEEEPKEEDVAPVIAEVVEEQPTAEPEEIGLVEEDKLEEPLVALYEEPPEELLLGVPEPEQAPEPEPKPGPVEQVEKEPVRQAPVIVPARRPDDEESATKKKGKGKRRRRQLIYDEDAGAVVTRRRRKRGHESEWDDYLE